MFASVGVVANSLTERCTVLYWITFVVKIAIFYTQIEAIGICTDIKLLERVLPLNS